MLEVLRGRPAVVRGGGGGGGAVRGEAVRGRGAGMRARPGVRRGPPGDAPAE